MATIILSHEVKDYSSWKPIYDADASRRQSAGFKELAVGTQSDKPNNVIMIWEGEPAAVENMLKDPALIEKMETAGVISPPEVTIVNT